jgi:hypothetical protein
VKDCDIQLYKDTGKLVPLPGLKVIVGENSRKVVICPVNYNSDSKLLIRPYSPDFDYDSEELVYQELVDRINRGCKK